MVSPSIEDYLKAIYNAGSEAGETSTQDLAGRLQVSAPAVSKMLRRLADLNLVTHTPYQGVQLTESGLKMALEIIRHHRLIELYLVQALGYGWDEVHNEAERLEHHISEEFEERIDALLGHPSSCPHGDPIPTRDGFVAEVSTQTLARQTAPGPLTIARVRDEDSALLRHLKELGLLPGTAIELVEQEPFGGAFVVRVAGREVRVAPGAAAQIFVGAARSGAEEAVPA